jgi:hypothetical protein
MERTTAAQSSPAPPYRVMPLQQPLTRSPAEYGCVDWYPYVTALENRTDLFETDLFQKGTAEAMSVG